MICITVSALVKNDKVKNRIVTTVKDKNNIKKAVTFFSEALSSFVRIFVKYKK